MSGRSNATVNVLTKYNRDAGRYKQIDPIHKSDAYPELKTSTAVNPQPDVARFSNRLEAQMYIRRIKGPHSVTLPDGTTMTRADLPDKSTRRWVASRKAAVVDAVDHGLITEKEALEIWSLSEEELDAWRSAVQRHGIAALRATALQRYRDASEE